MFTVGTILALRVKLKQVIYLDGGIGSTKVHRILMISTGCMQIGLKQMKTWSLATQYALSFLNQIRSSTKAIRFWKRIVHVKGKRIESSQFLKLLVKEAGELICWHQLQTISRTYKCLRISSTLLITKISRSPGQISALLEV